MKKFLRLGLPFLIVLLVAGLATGDVSYVIQQVSQSGTWTVQPGNTANTTPWLFTVSQGGNSATVDAGGALKVDASASTQPVSGTVTVTQGTGTNLHAVVDSGTVAATQSGSWVLSANSGVDIGDVTINNAAGGSAVNIQDGGNTITVDGTVTVTDGSGALNVIVDSGTTAVTQATASNLNAQVVGAAANGAAVSGNPLLVAGRADSTAPAAVTDGQAVSAFRTLEGKAVVLPYAGPGLLGTLSDSTSSSGDRTWVNADATYRICLTSVVIMKNDATTAVEYLIKTGGTTRWRTLHAATFNTPVQYQFPTPICSAINADLAVNLSAAVDSRFGLTYYKAAD